MAKWTLSDGTVYELTREQEKVWRKILKKDYRRNHGGVMRETKPLSKELRIRADEDGDAYWTEYGLFDGRGLTDEDIEEIIDSYRYIIRSLWDCTGLPHTCWITWHRNPTGLISYIHRVGLDI